MAPSAQAPAPVPATSTGGVRLTPLATFTPDLYERAWMSAPHPTLPLLATAHGRQATVFSLATLAQHSTLTGGHERSVRSVCWEPDTRGGTAAAKRRRLTLVTGSFDSTAGVWRMKGERTGVEDEDEEDETAASGDGMELDVAAKMTKTRGPRNEVDSGDEDEDDDSADPWRFDIVLEGQESEIKSVAFSSTGQYLATCSRDRSVWIWEHLGNDDDTTEEEEWDTVGVVNEHDGDVKCVSWCPPLNAATSRRYGRLLRNGPDELASASYDDTVRLWREDGEGDWVCVAVLEGHEGTVWSVQWEQPPPSSHPLLSTPGTRTRSGKYPRIATASADKTVRIWELQWDDEEDEDEEETGAVRDGRLGMIPNRMRAGPPRENWTCVATLPPIHTRDIYSVTWSGASGLVASTGSDGVLAVYGEVDEEPEPDMSTEDMEGGGPDKERKGSWRLLAALSNAHGPYEINHVTWCRRFDPGTDRKDIEEMLVTTGDDGTVRAWKVEVSPPSA